MGKKNLISLIVLFIVTLYFGSTLLSYFYIDGATFGAIELLLFAALTAAWGQFLAWNTREEAAKDEMGKEIKKTSGNISYHFVFYTLLTLWVVDYFILGHHNDYILMIGLCIAYLTHPVIQFVLVKKQVV